MGDRILAEGPTQMTIFRALAATTDCPLDTEGRLGCRATVDRSPDQGIAIEKECFPGREAVDVITH
jgi:hypothetical protein